MSGLGQGDEKETRLILGWGGAEFLFNGEEEDSWRRLCQEICFERVTSEIFIRLPREKSGGQLK